MAKAKKKSTTYKAKPKKRALKKIERVTKEGDSYSVEIAEDVLEDMESWGEAVDELPEPIEVEKLEDATKEETIAYQLLRKYRPPKNEKVFVDKWNEYLPDVAKRDNFKRGHLSQLELLCDLHVEYGKLKAFIDKHGYTYTAIGRSGTQHHQWPQVAQRNRCLSEIRMYAKILGLILTKDKELNTDPKTEKEWE